MLARASYVRDPALHVPAAVGYLAAGVFGCAALAMLHRAAGREAPAALAGVMLAALAGVGGWIAFAPEARACSVTLPGASALPLAGLACRLAFGTGAAITSATAAWAFREWWRPRRRG